jgi:hypothetical protein
MTEEDLKEVAYDILEAVRDGQSCLVVCGSDMPSSPDEKLEPLRLMALPI